VFSSPRTRCTHYILILVHRIFLVNLSTFLLLSINERNLNSSSTTLPGKSPKMFAAATSLFARTNVSQNYVICTPGQAPSPAIPSGSGAGSVLPVAPPAPPFKIGLWRVQSASHKTTGKRVSVWTFDKRGQDVDKLGPHSKERVVEILKSEVSEHVLVN
jgi:hypothetical protein